ncbi:hypothetical protein [Arenibaculum pallidiluteum]|uniref:hypothetical protein n=1 Tax=Arenibaculum pallidiluteum TaxID=2812559 RepID=UPI001A96DCAF|nr:hypothetical protein [Arenibaculum pallidiluteum]
MLGWLNRLLTSAFGHTGRDPDEREPLSCAYVASLSGLLSDGLIPVHTWVWALRARPASVCGRGGSYAVTSWPLEPDLANPDLRRSGETGLRL